jgi:sec-independent protein translocase protein TatB
MFDIGFLEIILCGIVALVVLGPEKLPHAARMAGAFVGKFTRLAQSVREDIEREVNLMEMQERIKKQVEKGVIGDLKDNVEQAKRMLREGYEQTSGGTPTTGATPPATEPAASPAMDPAASPATEPAASPAMPAPALTAPTPGAPVAAAEPPAAVPPDTSR